jgi:hypothetical protein
VIHLLGWLAESAGAGTSNKALAAMADWGGNLGGGGWAVVSMYLDTGRYVVQYCHLDLSAPRTGVDVCESAMNDQSTLEQSRSRSRTDEERKRDRESVREGEDVRRGLFTDAEKSN